MPLKGLRSTCIVETPEIVRAPAVVKVPVTLGNVEKSYTAVMVTGVGVEADVGGTEPIVEKATIARLSRSTTSSESRLHLCYPCSVGEVLPGRERGEEEI